MYNLDGRIALVTGAAQGIGRAIALRLAREGADLAINDLQAGRLDEVAAEIGSLGRRVVVLAADVTDATAVEGMVERAWSELGPIDILVNNAGIIRIVPLLEMADADWDALFAVNVRSMWLCSRAVGRRMVERNQGGRIINAASRAGKAPSRISATGAYVATKHAVVGFTRALALELAPYQITVNAYCPGQVDTPMWDAIDRETARRRGVPIGTVKAEAVAQIPLGRIEQPEDVAKLVAFLASDEADYMTGQSINIEGGTEFH